MPGDPAQWIVVNRTWWNPDTSISHLTPMWHIMFPVELSKTGYAAYAAARFKPYAYKIAPKIFPDIISNNIILFLLR